MLMNSCKAEYTLRNDVINMSQARDKEKLWVSYRNWNCQVSHESFVAQWLEHLTADQCTEGHRFNSSRGLRCFCLSHARDMLITSFLASSQSLKFTIILYLSEYNYVVYKICSQVKPQLPFNPMIKMNNCGKEAKKILIKLRWILV